MHGNSALLRIEPDAVATDVRPGESLLENVDLATGSALPAAHVGVVA